MIEQDTKLMLKSSVCLKHYQHNDREKLIYSSNKEDISE